MLRALEQLAKDPSVHIYVISGRDQVALDKWLGFIDRLGMRSVLREELGEGDHLQRRAWMLHPLPIEHGMDQLVRGD